MKKTLKKAIYYVTRSDVLPPYADIFFRNYYNLTLYGVVRAVPKFLFFYSDLVIVCVKHVMC